MQQKNYWKRDRCMKNPEIYKSWEKFIDEYGEYFKSSEKIWNETL